VIILDRLLVGGIGWALRRIAEAVDAERFDESALREELLAAQMRLELGEIDEERFAAIERELLARLREIRKQTRGAPALPAKGERYAIEAIDADTGDDAGADLTGTSDRSPPATSAARRSKGRSRGRARSTGRAGHRTRT
jgi:hypothetical protein